MLKRLVALRALNRAFLIPRTSHFSTQGLIFQKTPSETTSPRAGIQSAEPSQLPASLKSDETQKEELAPENEGMESAEEASKDYDPDWYVHSEEDDLPLSTDEVKGFTPRWLKSSQESPDESPHDSEIVPSALSKDLFEKFFVEQRASDFTYIDVSGNCEWASAMIVVQGQSLRHIQAMSDSARRFVRLYFTFEIDIVLRSKPVNHTIRLFRVSLVWKEMQMMNGLFWMQAARFCIS